MKTDCPTCGSIVDINTFEIIQANAVAVDYLVDSKNREWHVMERDDGSISVYYTTPKSSSLHFVVWDELDNKINP